MKYRTLTVSPRGREEEVELILPHRCGHIKSTRGAIICSLLFTFDYIFSRFFRFAVHICVIKNRFASLIQVPEKEKIFSPEWTKIFFLGFNQLTLNIEREKIILPVTGKKWELWSLLKWFWCWWSVRCALLTLKITASLSCVMEVRTSRVDTVE